MRRWLRGTKKWAFFSRASNSVTSPKLFISKVTFSVKFTKKKNFSRTYISVAQVGQAVIVLLTVTIAGHFSTQRAFLGTSVVEAQVGRALNVRSAIAERAHLATVAFGRAHFPLRAKVGRTLVVVLTHPVGAHFASLQSTVCGTHVCHAQVRVTVRVKLTVAEAGAFAQRRTVWRTHVRKAAPRKALVVLTAVTPAAHLAS